MSAQSELIPDWINKADHDLGLAKLTFTKYLKSPPRHQQCISRQGD